ncbi:MAG: protein kinase [Planctomycetes bacterium]|nr:protein kinase [Planctomycetota bacterium]
MEPTPLGLVGRRLGDLRVLGHIGSGGMGSVYRARDEALDREVAIKVLPPGLAEDPELVRRLRREARLAARVDHPNVATVYRFGEDEGVLYIAMRLVRGPTLAGVLREGGALDWRVALRVAREVALALDAAHAVGLVHRDVKPDNVLLEPVGRRAPDGETVALDEGGRPLPPLESRAGGLDPATARVVVTDFGLARPLDPNAVGTATGTYLGTPRYSSPEQCRGGKVDARSDLYSLGVVLYEMLSGRVPYRADTPLALFEKIVRDPVPPLTGVPEGVAALLEALLAKRPEDRPARAADVVAILDGLLAGDPAVVGLRAPHRVATGRRRWAMVAVLGASAALVLGLYLLTRHVPDGPGPGTCRPQVRVQDFRNPTGDPDLEWLTLGLADMVITDLSQSRLLAVLGRGSAPEAAARFQVSGEVTRVETTLRVDLRAEDAQAGGRVVASASERGPLEDIFQMVDRLVVSLRRQLEETGRPEAPRVPSGLLTQNVLAERSSEPEDVPLLSLLCTPAGPRGKRPGRAEKLESNRADAARAEVSARKDVATAGKGRSAALAAAGRLDEAAPPAPPASAPHVAREGGRRAVEAEGLAGSDLKREPRGSDNEGEAAAGMGEEVLPPAATAAGLAAEAATQAVDEGGPPPGEGTSLVHVMRRCYEALRTAESAGADAERLRGCIRTLEGCLEDQPDYQGARHWLSVLRGRLATLER